MLNKDYKKLKATNYRKYTTCQLPGCNKPLKKKFGQKVIKYCCPEHALEAKKLYLAEWKRRHKENVKVWNHRYWLRQKRKKNNQVTI